MPQESRAKPAPGNLPEWTVSELSAALKRTVEDSYNFVRVRGELGNVKYHSSGHVYLDLKDDKACLAGVIWRTQAARIKTKLEAGLEVVVTGHLTTFPGQSKYQIVIDSLAPAGIGALMALLDERKKKLAAEGLFADARKQLVPFLPRVIGIITSPTGAVIRDILHRLADRFPRDVLVWPVRVQGDGAAEQIAAAIRGFNALPESGRIPRPDVLIVARGGGSLEDLWCFNEEIVVRAAAESLIPLISAVGHETDFTLLDFVADKRAPTPSAAAEMAVPVRSELIVQVSHCARRSQAGWLRGLDSRRTEFRSASRALPTREGLLAIARQRLDVAADRVPRALIANAQVHHTRSTRVMTRLSPSLLKNRLSREQNALQSCTSRLRHCTRVTLSHRSQEFANAAGRHQAALRANLVAHRVRIGRERERLDHAHHRATRAIHQLMETRSATLDRHEQILAALSYQGVLARGFALVRDSAGRPLRHVAMVKAGSALDIEFTDGRVNAIAASGSIVLKKIASKKPKSGSTQGSLL